MAQFFFTSFAAAENAAYVRRFHDDLMKELDSMTGGRIGAALCVGGGSGRPAVSAASRPAATVPVMVALCSDAYYADEGCGLDWALMERRLSQSPPQLSSPRVLVRWQPADPPQGLPRAPFHGTDPDTDYARIGLLGIMHQKGWRGPRYADAVRRIALAVRAGHEARLPALPPDEQADVRAAFPVGPLNVPGQRRPLDSAPEAPADRERRGGPERRGGSERRAGSERRGGAGGRRRAPGPPHTLRPVPPPALPADAERQMATAELPDGHLYYISYARTDEEWACWVEFHVRMLGHRTVMDVYDWEPGSPTAARRMQALDQADRIIALISPASVRPDSPTLPEWSDALLRRGRDGSWRLLPLLIGETELPALLRDMITASLVGLEEPAARAVVAAALTGRGERRRPHDEPPLPSS